MPIFDRSTRTQYTPTYNTGTLRDFSTQPTINTSIQTGSLNTGGSVPRPADAGAQTFGSHVPAGGTYYGVPFSEWQGLTPEEKEARKQSATQKKIDQQHENQQYEWDKWEKPRIEAQSRAIEQEALNEANRALAEMQARYGYQRSAGAGTAGMWQMGQFNLEGKAMQVRTMISTLNADFMRNAETAFYGRKDNESFQKEMLKLQSEYREQYAEKIAELNEGSWWSKLGSIVGSMLALTGGGVPTEYGVGSWLKGIGYRLS